METTTIYNERGGFRFDIRNPPEPGTRLTTTSGEDVVFDEIGPAGMLVCTRQCDGSQQMYFPHSFNIKNGDG